MYQYLVQNSFLTFQYDDCKVLDKLVEDESYAYYVGRTDKGQSPCVKYQNCEVVTAPFTEGKSSSGSGWMFPKRSPLLPIFNKYFWELKEAGHYERIYHQPEYDPFKLLPDQECKDLDGDPISQHKVISLFTMFFSIAFLSSVIFW